MTVEFMLADVGRDIVASGGIGTITGYTDPQTVTVEITQEFPATSFDALEWAILGSPVTTCTPSAAQPVGATISLTLGAAGWRAEDVGKYVQLNGGLCKITAKTSDLVVQATIETELAAAVAAPAYAWTLEATVWGGLYGYPRCGTLYEQRHWLAGSPGFPQTFWGSVIGEFFNFTLGTLDTDALSYVISSGELNPIMHMVNARGLMALTNGGEFSIKGGQEKPITPTNISVKDQTNYGSAQVPPVRVGQEIFSVQRAGRKVRAIAPNQYDDAQYVAPDMTVLAEHVTESTLAAMSHQPEPDSLLFGARQDGQLATLTCDRDQDVFGWSRQVTQGAYLSIEVVPTLAGSSVFMAVARTIAGVTTYCIEMFDVTLNTDGALTGTSVGGATVWAGLEHLEGRTVQALGDGVYLGEFVVVGGSITLPRAAFYVEIGLAFVTTIKTLTPEVQTQAGSSQGQRLSIHEVKVRLLRTIGCTINLQEVPFRKLGLGVLDKPPAPFTGLKTAGNLEWGDGVAQTLIQQTLPYPFHVLAVITKLSINEG